MSWNVSMSAKMTYLALLLVLGTAWLVDFEQGSLLGSWRGPTPPFGEEIYPIARSHRMEIQRHLDQLPHDVGPGETILAPTSSHFLSYRPRKPIFSPLASADSCYVQMSLQL